MRFILLAAPLFLLGCKEPLVVKRYLALVNISPSQGATQVSPDTAVVATFSEPLLANSVSAQSAFLEDASGLPIVASTLYDTVAHSIVITPETDLAQEAAYTVTFTAAIKGKNSGQLMGAVRSTFTTAGWTPENGLPVANAGVDQEVAVGATVQLDGNSSMDPEGADLTALWRLVSTPAESTTVLSDTETMATSLVPDMPGEYVIGLVVNDGLQDSSEDFVAVLALGTAPPPDTGASDTGNSDDTGSSDEPSSGDDTGADEGSGDDTTSDTGTDAER